MRLLNALTLQFQEFFDTQVPKYGILSHRWGPGEVSYQSFINGSTTNSAGHNKILHSCSWALAEGLEYIWIDTCCIDKTSSAELTEAINSMYNWYQKSSICVAYLNDVSPGLASDQEQLHEALRKSEWFDRGWTLQELLAPRFVKFVDQEWNHIGSKEDLAAIIMDITCIHTRFLHDADLVQEASIAARMSWASKRKTTRREDMAYCLLGIFNVNMPLLYGEGDKAFFRLQQQIIEYSDDESIFAWTSDQEVGGMIADSPRWFAGSKDIMAFSVRPEERVPYKWTNKGLELQLNDSDMLLRGGVNCGWPSFNATPSGFDEAQMTLGCWKCEDISIDPTTRLSKVIQDKVFTIQLQRQGATWRRIRCNELILSKRFEAGYHVPGMPRQRRQYHVSQEPVGLKLSTTKGGPVGSIIRNGFKMWKHWGESITAPYYETELSAPQKFAKSATNLVYNYPVIRPYFDLLQPPKPLKQAAEVAISSYGKDGKLDEAKKEHVRQLLLETLESI